MLVRASRCREQKYAVLEAFALFIVGKGWGRHEVTNYPLLPALQG